MTGLRLPRSGGQLPIGGHQALGFLRPPQLIGALAGLEGDPRDRGARGLRTILPGPMSPPCRPRARIAPRRSRKRSRRHRRSDGARPPRPDHPQGCMCGKWGSVGRNRVEEGGWRAVGRRLPVPRRDHRCGKDFGNTVGLWRRSGEYSPYRLTLSWRIGRVSAAGGVGRNMARSDLLVELVKAGVSGDQASVPETAEAIAAEERAKKHSGVADRISMALTSADRRGMGGPTRHGGLRVRDGSGGIQRREPHRPLAELFLDRAIRDACLELIEEQHRADVLRAHGIEPRHRLLLVGAARERQDIPRGEPRV